MDWKTWLKGGDQYLRAASGKNGAPSKFSPVVRYNLLAMGLEGYVMAAVDAHRNLPDNHTFTDLMEAMDKYCPIDPELRAKIIHYENAQHLCRFDQFTIRELTAPELDDFRSVVTELGAFAHAECERMASYQRRLEVAQDEEAVSACSGGDCGSCGGCGH